MGQSNYFGNIQATVMFLKMHGSNKNLNTSKASLYVNFSSQHKIKKNLEE